MWTCDLCKKPQYRLNCCKKCNFSVCLDEPCNSRLRASGKSYFGEPFYECLYCIMVDIEIKTGKDRTQIKSIMRHLQELEKDHQQKTTKIKENLSQLIEKYIETEI